MKLSDLIEQGNKDILSNNNKTVAAIAYMAYHAGISKGDFELRNEIKEISKKKREAAMRERYKHLANKYIFEPSTVQYPEFREILDFDF